MTLVTLFLVIFGSSEYPRQARDGKAKGEGPIMAHCPGTEQPWHTALGQIGGRMRWG